MADLTAIQSPNNWIRHPRGWFLCGSGSLGAFYHIDYEQQGPDFRLLRRDIYNPDGRPVFTEFWTIEEEKQPISNWWKRCLWEARKLIDCVKPSGSSSAKSLDR